MSWIKPLLVRVVGYAFVGVVFYSLIFVGLYVISVALLRAGTPQEIWPLQQFQRDYYFDGVRSMWQYDPLCAVVDERLVYKPQNGKCLFRNFEFETTLSFDSYGRAVPKRVDADYKQLGIAIIGDSHAMGWGVNDDDTFANVIQQHTKKPVFNLAVSSYATERQLKRLIISGLIDKVDTVVIQYCDNDLNENQKQLSEDDYFELSRSFADELNNRKNVSPGKVRYIARKVKFALRYPLDSFKLSVRRFLGMDVDKNSFDDHGKALRDVLLRYEEVLGSKKVMVFYSNEHGNLFENFPRGRDSEVHFLEYVQPELNKTDYFLIDSHLNSEGHKRIGRFLSEALKLF